MTAASPPIVLRGLTKRYGNTWALRGLDLALAPGEILGVAGPNGAGKSTLMRVLAGEESVDDGEIQVGRRTVGARELGGHVAVVHQEPQLFPNMTVAENLLVGREAQRFRRPQAGKAEARLMATLGITTLADRLLADCSLAVRQRVEIGRALAREAGVFLFDEPNSALAAKESTALFAELRRLAAAGNIVLLVTHRLEDLVQHTRRVVVVRDGRIAAELTGGDLTEEAIIHLLVQGLEPAGVDRSSSAALGTETSSEVLDLGFPAPPDAVVALLGVEGSGAREFLRAYAGFAESAAPSHAIAPEQAAYVAPSRADNLFGNFSVGGNALARLGRPDIAYPTGTLARVRMRQVVGQAINRFRVRTVGGEQPITALSGGNQQKVAIAQALLKRPRLALFEEPTRGVDIGSKREIYALLRNAAARGTRVMIFCTEVLEAFEAADQVHMFVAGRFGPPIKPADFPTIESFASVVAQAAGKTA